MALSTSRISKLKPATRSRTRVRLSLRAGAALTILSIFSGQVWGENEIGSRHGHEHGQRQILGGSPSVGGLMLQRGRGSNDGLGGTKKQNLKLKSVAGNGKPMNMKQTNKPISVSENPKQQQSIYFACGALMSMCLMMQRQQQQQSMFQFDNMMCYVNAAANPNATKIACEQYQCLEECGLEKFNDTCRDVPEDYDGTLESFRRKLGWVPPPMAPLPPMAPPSPPHPHAPPSSPPCVGPEVTYEGGPCEQGESNPVDRDIIWQIKPEVQSACPGPGSTAVLVTGTCSDVLVNQYGFFENGDLPQTVNGYQEEKGYGIMYQVAPPVIDVSTGELNQTHANQGLCFKECGGVKTCYNLSTVGNWTPNSGTSRFYSSDDEGEVSFVVKPCNKTV